MEAGFSLLTAGLSPVTCHVILDSDDWRLRLGATRDEVRVACIGFDVVFILYSLYTLRIVSGARIRSTN